MSDSEVETDIFDTEQCNDVSEANNNDNAVESFEAKHPGWASVLGPWLHPQQEETLFEWC